MNLSKYAELKIDISKTPFSKYGSNLSLFNNNNKYGGLLLINSMRKWGQDYSFYIIFKYKDKIVKPIYNASVKCVTAKFENANATFYIREDNELVGIVFGFDIFILPYNKKDHYHGIEFPNEHYEIITGTKRFYTTIKVFEGYGELKKPNIYFVQSFKLKSYDKKANMLIKCNEKNKSMFLINLSEEQIKTSNIQINTEKELSQTENNWLDFLKTMPEVLDIHEEFAVFSWYNLWTSVIRKSRAFKYDCMLMNKKKMNAIWSWDNCFNSLSLMKNNLEFALNQLELSFIYQSKNGALPDVYSYNDEIYYTITKPPIHGWAFKKIMDYHPNLSSDILINFYEKFKKQTNWWLEFRDSDGDGIPDYPIGCDSGIDNASVFIGLGEYVECPDLPSYLILQMETLAIIAKKLNMLNEANLWIEKSKKLLDIFLTHSVKNNMFVSLKTRTHLVNDKTQCFINYMPLILGKRLPENLRKNLINNLIKNNVTEYGIASESPNNKKYYKSDGYWRGPIWAPSTYLLIDALRECGELSLAKNIAEKYLNMVCNVAKGNYENFDALSGRGLRAEGYTWTASVTILLMNELYLGEL